jgi:hypothetical protein
MTKKKVKAVIEEVQDLNGLETFDGVENVIVEDVDPIAARKAAELDAGFLNPYGVGTSYVEFLAAVKDAEVTVVEYCEMHLTEDEIEFIEKELLILLN